MSDYDESSYGGIDDGMFPPYVSVAERTEQAARLVAKLIKSGKKISPVVVHSKTKIATSFWGQEWCRSIQKYEDLAHRTQRGRSYVRSGAVIDLQIKEKNILAKVKGTRLYKVDVSFDVLTKEQWEQFVKKCTGEIESLVDLMAGRLPEKIIELVTDQEQGLFPRENELKFSCSCPDYASLCKHVAATLYGVGVRFDEDPKLFFLLRGVDPLDLMTHATKSLSNVETLDDKNLGDLFDIDLI